MKKRLVFAMTSLLLFAIHVGAVAQENETDALTFSIAVTGGYYFESSHTTESGTHFQGLSSAYYAFALAVTPMVEYTIPFLTADNALMADNHLTINAGLEITPASLTPNLSLSFTPIALLELKVGSKAGTGWLGMSEYSFEKPEYEDLTAFKHWYLYNYASATLMFDFGAVWEGDWHHIVTTASYEIAYQKLTGTDRIWRWQASAFPLADGWVYAQHYFLGYMMPIRLSMIGVDCALMGNYKSSDFGEVDESYDGDFMLINISPMIQIKLGSSEKDTLIILGSIIGRRSFEEEWEDSDKEPLYTKNGREFYFDSIGAVWKHTF